MLKQPKFTHDCDHCIYLGRFIKHDLYVCQRFNIIDTVLARYGEEENNYISGLDYAMLYGSKLSSNQSGRILFEALKRATARGFKPPSWELKREK